MQSSARWMALQGRRLQSAVTHKHFSMMLTLNVYTHTPRASGKKWPVVCRQRIIALRASLIHVLSNHCLHACLQFLPKSF